MIISTSPAMYLPSDGMTPCGFPDCAAPGPTVAVHVLQVSLPVARIGTHLCGYHSPWDVVTVPDPEPLIVCARPLAIGLNGPDDLDDVIIFRMSLSRRVFDRGVAGGIRRPVAPGGHCSRRVLLPLV